MKIRLKRPLLLALALLVTVGLARAERHRIIALVQRAGFPTRELDLSAEALRNYPSGRFADGTPRQPGSALGGLRTVVDDFLEAFADPTFREELERVGGMMGSPRTAVFLYPAERRGTGGLLPPTEPVDEGTIWPHARLSDRGPASPTIATPVPTALTTPTPTTGSSAGGKVGQSPVIPRSMVGEVHLGSRYFESAGKCSLEDREDSFRSTVLHEFGHAGDLERCADDRTRYGPDGKHFSDEVLTPAMAFTEGWAKYCAARTQENRGDSINPAFVFSSSTATRLRVETMPGPAGVSEYRALPPRFEFQLANEAVLRDLFLSLEIMLGRDQIEAAFQATAGTSCRHFGHFLTALLALDPGDAPITEETVADTLGVGASDPALLALVREGTYPLCLPPTQLPLLRPAYGLPPDEPFRTLDSCGDQARLIEFSPRVVGKTSASPAPVLGQPLPGQEGVFGIPPPGQPPAP